MRRPTGCECITTPRFNLSASASPSGAKPVPCTILPRRSTCFSWAWDGCPGQDRACTGRSSANDVNNPQVRHAYYEASVFGSTSSTSRYPSVCTSDSRRCRSLLYWCVAKAGSRSVVVRYGIIIVNAALSSPPPWPPSMMDDYRCVGWRRWCGSKT